METEYKKYKEEYLMIRVSADTYHKLNVLAKGRGIDIVARMILEHGVNDCISALEHGA